MGSNDPRISTPDARFIYEEFKDTSPSDEDLDTLKGMLAASVKGTMWSRLLTLLSIIGYGILMWMSAKKAEIRMLLERHGYEMKRAHEKKDQIEKDTVGNRPRED